MIMLTSYKQTNTDDKNNISPIKVWTSALFVTPVHVVGLYTGLAVMALISAVLSIVTPLCKLNGWNMDWDLASQLGAVPPF